MYLYQYLIMLGYVLLLTDKEVRYHSLLILTSFLFYAVVINKFPYNYYYLSSATMCAFIGMMTCEDRFYSSLCSFLIVPCSYMGYLLAYNYQPVYIYDNIVAILLIMQFIFMLPRVLLNGISARINSKYWLVRSFDITSSKKDIALLKRKKTKGLHQ